MSLRHTLLLLLLLWQPTKHVILATNKKLHSRTSPSSSPHSCNQQKTSFSHSAPSLSPWSHCLLEVRRKGTRFSPTDNELLEHFKEKTDQTNSMSYPFIDVLIPLSMVRRISSALSFLVLMCILKLFLSVS
jgi:hypothetical protein